MVGLGYVGLPTAIAFHDAGLSVIGVDVSERVIKELKDGAPLVDSSSDLSVPVGSPDWDVTMDLLMLLIILMSFLLLYRLQ